jgi:hypothetical protein
VPWNDVVRAERRIVASRFHGRRGQYLRALGRRKARLGVARALIADQLRRRQLEAGPAAASGYAAWSRAERAAALESTSCRLDEVPRAAPVDAGAAVGFLRLPSG